MFIIFKIINILLLIVLISFADNRPNILFCISDDQSYAHAGANCDSVVKMPDFDQLAKNGLRFEYGFCNAPSCGPSRSPILTGQSIWRLEEAVNIWSTLLKDEKDPRIIGGKVLWDYYPHYGGRKSKSWKIDKIPADVAQ